MPDLATTHLALVREGAPDLTSRQWAMMAVLCDGPGPHDVKDIAEALNVSKPVVSRMHTTLAKMGLVVRLPDPHDRRRASVAPTHKGRLLRKRVA